MPDVVRSIDIQAPPSSIWRWLATQEGLRRWLGSDLEIDLRPGGAYSMAGGDGETRISGTVLELIPEGELALSWLEEGSGWRYPARLVVSLTAIAGGTRVTLAHDGFAGIGKPGWERTAEAYERGADRHRVLERLAEVVTTARV
jgi:uncharacterized protein YndB with AHSA1/START domain